MAGAVRFAVASMTTKERQTAGMCNRCLCSSVGQQAYVVRLHRYASDTGRKQAPELHRDGVDLLCHPADSVSQSYTHYIETHSDYSLCLHVLSVSTAGPDLPVHLPLPQICDKAKLKIYLIIQEAGQADAQTPGHPVYLALVDLTCSVEVLELVKSGLAAALEALVPSALFGLITFSGKVTSCSQSLPTNTSMRLTPL